MVGVCVSICILGGGRACVFPQITRMHNVLHPLFSCRPDPKHIIMAKWKCGTMWRHNIQHIPIMRLCMRQRLEGDEWVRLYDCCDAFKRGRTGYKSPNDRGVSTVNLMSRRYAMSTFPLDKKCELQTHPRSKRVCVAAKPAEWVFGVGAYTFASVQRRQCKCVMKWWWWGRRVKPNSSNSDWIRKGLSTMGKMSKACLASVTDAMCWNSCLKRYDRQWVEILDLSHIMQITDVVFSLREIHCEEEMNDASRRSECPGWFHSIYLSWANIRTLYMLFIQNLDPSKWVY